MNQLIRIGCVVMAPVTVDTVCREWCGNTPAVGLDVLVAGVVVEDDVGHRDSKWVCGLCCKEDH